ncbi:Ig-like domain-containing protein [Aureitalea marina]|uniref:Fibronectin type-III domain-containing protein n=1 Tax=Aureitalea marina TaxID=930804 RepID=A0A2S7KNH1_9FLAO|nr:Ig-like domain-containing protein [Aureitalea marina]PQB04113.1 hypothetical protein BST85_03750 [Aureitalea marina]
MKKLLTCLLFVCATAWAGNDKYRIIINDDPATTITIAWNQTSGSNPVVYYGTTDHGTNYLNYAFSKTVDRSVASRGMSNQFVRLTGLSPNTNYYFVIHDSEGTSSRFWFRTAPNDLSRLSFIAGGDSRNNRTPRQNANSLVSKLKPHAVFFGGDMTNADTNGEWQNWMDDWQLTTAADGRMFPIVAARGNHEGASVIYELFDTPDSDSYYAVTFGDNLVRAYTLNSEISVTGNQLTWLTNDLSANPDVIWKTAQYHKPMTPHTSGKSEGTDIYNAWAQLFYDEGVRLVVDCDSHTVKTTWPVRPDTGAGSELGFIQDDTRGTVYAGEGCWGAPTRVNDDDKVWTRDSGSFNQFKWIFVGTDRIELRTIRVDNAPSVGENTNTDPFAIPANLDIWNPSNGSLVTIYPVGDVPIVEFPEDTAQNYASGSNLELSVDILDDGAGLSNVEFYVDNSLVYTDTQAPYSFTNTYGVGSYKIRAVANATDGKSGSDAISINVGSFGGSDSVAISNGDDDIEEEEDGTMYFNSSDLEFVNDGGRGYQKIGLRFNSIDIPQGATITSARIQFTSDSFHDNANAEYNIYAEDEDHADPFGTADDDLTDRDMVSGAVNWTPPTWNVGSNGTAQRTPQLTSLLQQVVDRCNWASGNSVVFKIEGAGQSLTDPTAKRRARTYDDDPSYAAVLSFTYSYNSSEFGNLLDIAFEDMESNYTNGSNIDFDVDVRDLGAGIQQVQFLVNGSLVATDNTAPYQLTHSFGNGSHQVEAIATDACGDVSAMQYIHVGDITSTTISKRIEIGKDDVEEEEDGGMYSTSSDLEMVNNDNDGGRGNQKIGLRFNEIVVPQGATITDAYVQFRSDETNSVRAELLLYVQDAANAEAFGTEDYNVTNRDRVSGSVYWNPQLWSAVGQTGTDQRTSDISSLVQQVVDRCDWQSGNSVAVFIEGTGNSLTNANAKVVGDSYEGSSGNAPQLVITYSYDATDPSSTNVTRFTGGGWSNGTPDSASKVILTTDYDTTVEGGGFEACSLEILAGNTLTVQAGDYLDIQGDLVVNGNLIVKHQGIVVQDDNKASVINNGNIQVEVTTPNLLRADFMAVGSPMSSETRINVFAGVRNVQYHTPSNFIANSSVPGATNFADDNRNFWQHYTNGPLNSGEAYLIFPQDNPSGTVDLTFDRGTLNNGDVVVNKVYNGVGVNPNGTPNIYANPYASPISADDFLSANGLSNVYFWEHITAPSSGIPGPYSNNYSMDDISIYNDVSGGLAAANDGGGTTQPNGIISTAQGFGVLATSAGTVTFTNSMRRTSGNTTLRTQDLQLDRMWLRVSNDAYEYPLGSNTLIAYSPEATDGLDAGDTNRIDTSVSLYSLISGTNKALTIQSLEQFDQDDKISLGFSTLVEADLEYTIALTQVQGTQIGSRSIYLIDNLFGTVTDLTQEEYSFRSGASDQPGRFTVQFESQILSTAQIDLEAIGMYPNPTTGVLNIASPRTSINHVTIYDLQGREVKKLTDSKNMLQLDLSDLNSMIYMVRIETTSGITTKKLIKR